MRIFSLLFLIEVIFDDQANSYEIMSRVGLEKKMTCYFRLTLAKWNSWQYEPNIVNVS